MSNRKKFFRKRTPDQILDELSSRRVCTGRNLVENIWEDLDENSQALILMFPIIPPHFLSSFKSQAQSSRKDYKHGLFVPVVQPATVEESYQMTQNGFIPMNGRMQALDTNTRGKDEREINYLGISWKPIQGNDGVPRFVPFDAVHEGIKIYAYAHQHGSGIEVNANYTNSQIVQREGAQVLCKVPSRTKRMERYHVNLRHVPLLQGKEENAVVLSLKPHYEEGEVPERTTFMHELLYRSDSGRAGSDRIVFGPHEIAAYLAIIRDNWKGVNSTVPLRMNPFPIFSKGLFKFAEKLDSNILVYDPTLQSKRKLRNLHLDERCILMSRAIGVKGVWKTVYWDSRRDGSLKEYTN